MSDAPWAALSPKGRRRPFIPWTFTEAMVAPSQSQERLAVTFARRRRTGMTVLPPLPATWSILPDIGMPRELMDVLPLV